ncbi:MAG TPA: ABC transporter permease [Anaerolineae bacterium]|nr:ABC transporter permease [Anaerolineae bacterium]
MLGAFDVWQRDLKLIRKFWVFFAVLLLDIVLLLLAFGPAMTRLLPRFAYPAGSTTFQIDYFTFFVPGLVVLVVMQASLYMGEMSYIDRDMGVLEILFTAPMSRWSICLGKLASATTVAAVIAGTLYVVSFALGFRPYDVGIGSAVVLLIILTASWGFAGCSIATVMQIRSTSRWLLLLGAILSPLTAAAALQYPVQVMPEWIRPIAGANPLTHAVDMVRAAALEGRWPDITSLIGLFGFAIVGTLLAVTSMKHSRLLGR